MADLIRNVLGSRIARSTRRSGPFGKMARLGAAKRVSTGRGITGNLARGRIYGKSAGLGFGVLAGLGALVAGIFGMRRMSARSRMNRQRHTQQRY